MKVFLSYRRSDTAYLAQYIVDKLKEHPGIQGTFLDVESIPAGAAFDAAIQDELRKSDVVLVLIGPGWEAPRPETEPRLFDEDDYVRHEVRLSLESEKRVIPVLVDGRLMPTAGELPSDLAGLLMLHGVEVRASALPRDVRTLIHHLRPPAPALTWPARIGRSVAGLLTAGVALLTIGVGSVLVTGEPLQTMLNATADATTAVIVVTLLLGAIVPWWFWRPRPS